MILFIDVNILEGFEETSSLNLSDFQDVAFFSMQDEHQQTLWLAAAVYSSNISLYQFVVRYNILIKY